MNSIIEIVEKKKLSQNPNSLMKKKNPISELKKKRKRC